MFRLFNSILRLADNIGYESEIIVDLEDEHAYVKIYEYWDKENYCILDLIEEPKCFIQEKEIFEGNFAKGSITFNQDLIINPSLLNNNQKRKNDS